MSSKIMTSNFCKKTIGFKDFWTIIKHLDEVGDYNQLYQLLNKAVQVLNKASEKNNENIYNLPDFRTISDVDGYTLLHLACFHNCFCIVEILLQYLHGDIINQYDAINAQDSYGNTPLHIAAIYGHIEIMNLLIIKSADVLIKNNDGLIFTELVVLNNHGNMFIHVLATLNDHCSRFVMDKLINISLKTYVDNDIYLYLQ